MKRPKPTKDPRNVRHFRSLMDFAAKGRKLKVTKSRYSYLMAGEDVGKSVSDYASAKKRETLSDYDHSAMKRWFADNMGRFNALIPEGKRATFLNGFARGVEEFYRA